MHYRERVSSLLPSSCSATGGSVGRRVTLEGPSEAVVLLGTLALTTSFLSTTVILLQYPLSIFLPAEPGERAVGWAIERLWEKVANKIFTQARR